jgi:hypothetical protein
VFAESVCMLGPQHNLMCVVEIFHILLPRDPLSAILRNRIGIEGVYGGHCKRDKRHEQEGQQPFRRIIGHRGAGS